jgi:tripartite-type tricarboxylate transporter receptor subunit TctC
MGKEAVMAGGVRLASIALGALALGIVATAVRAQDYPAKPIRMFVPFPAGGPADALARALAPAMGANLKQSVVVENKPGASGTIGVDAVAKAAPDGYTIGISGGGALVIIPFMTDLPYNVGRDLAPVTVVGRVASVMVASTQSGFKSVADLIAFAKANPGKVNFASAGVGTTIHLAGELFNLEAGVKMVHVPYRGAAPAVADLLGGHVQIMLPDLPAVLEQVRSGKLTALAVVGRERSPSLPDTPSMADVGLPRVVSESWYGLIAPAGVPRPVLAKLNAAAVDALKAPDVAAQIARLGATPAPGPAEAFRELIDEEQKKWKAVVQATGLKM